MVADLVVVGAGPGGLTCATAACRLGLQVTVVEALALGGQLVNIAEIELAPPGLAPGTMGWDLAADLADEAQDVGASIEFAQVRGAVLHDGSWQVTGPGLDVTARAVVLATGTTADPIMAEGADRLAGLGVSTCAACDGPLFAGRPVAVVGGGDVARWEAQHLAGLAEHVLVLAPTISWPEEALPANVEVVAGARLASVEGGATVEGIRYTDAVGQPHDVAVAAVFNAVGRSPAPVPVDGAELDSSGAFEVDQLLTTTTPRVFAVGDVRSGSLHRLAGAMADGERAATAVAASLSG